MLNFKEKVNIFTSILAQKEISYADSFNADIDTCSNNCNYNILEKLNSKEDIKNWIAKLKSRIVMREGDDLLGEIINDYILCG